MHRSFVRNLKKKIRGNRKNIDPEDIFIDSANLPGFSKDRFEGRIERPISSLTINIMKGFILIVIMVFAGKLWILQVNSGERFAEISENNRLDHGLVFANRGLIYDRNKIELATNSIKSEGAEFARRTYTATAGLAHILGYVKYPKKDKAGFYFEEEYRGQSGVEKSYDELLSGKNGLKITETDARGKTISESVIEKPEDGDDLVLSMDSRITSELYKKIEEFVKERGFTGGAGIIMDVETGEILALTSYPEFDANVMTDGTDSAAITALFNNTSTPLLNRAVSGLYTPGSIVKPIVALGALHEGIVDPFKSIYSSGSISLPNPYSPDNPTIFRDWKAHGWVNMRDAIGLSSDVYFYAIGGGFEDQKGLGITLIDKYFRLFGMEESTGIDLPGEKIGTIASVDWKAENFPEDPEWRIGNSYHTSIGQYGTQITPLEAIRWVASIANGGKLLVPSVVLGGKPKNERVYRTLSFPESEWKVIREGMRQGVNGRGAINSLNSPVVEIAAKTGTAELGSRKQFVNSWVTGYFPYERPRYAFAIIMEKGPAENIIGATAVMRYMIDWMALYTPEYLK